MEAFALGGLILLVLIYLVYSSLKTKKIYSEDLDYEPKNEELMKRIEKRLLVKGYKFKTIHKYDYAYMLNETKEKILLPRVRVYRRGLKKYGLLINNETESIKENSTLKKQALEFINTGILKEIIVFNVKSGSLEFLKKRKNPLIIFIEVVFLLLLCFGIYYILIGL